MTAGARWLAIGGRALLAVAVLGGLVLVKGHVLLRWLLPYLGLVVELLQPRMATFARMCTHQGEEVACVGAKLLETIPLTPALVLPRFSTLPDVHGRASFILMPCVALLAAVLAWPAAHRRELVVRLVAAVLACGLLLTLTGAVQLAAAFDMMVDLRAQQDGAQTHPLPMGLIWADILLETGGTLLLTAVLAVLCIRGGRGKYSRRG